MRIQLVTITPKRAMEWLSKSKPNMRNIRQGKTGSLARDMKSGNWIVNGETIKINPKGELLDGRHRLTACVQSEAVFQSYVAFDVTDDSFATIDSGSPRTTGDVLAHRGEQNARNLAAVLVWIGTLLQTGKMQKFGLTPKKRVFSHTEIISILVDHPGVVDFILPTGGKERYSLSNPSFFAALRYVTSRIDQAKSELFFHQVQRGEGLTARDPAFVLRKRLIESRSNQVSKMPLKYECAIIIKAWNTFYTNSPAPKFYRLNSDTEEFPDIAGWDGNKGEEELPPL